jgi:hypothetical protein
MTKGRMPYRVCGPLLFALLLSACDEGTRPSAAENEQLNNAAEMLDAAPDTLANIDESTLAGPEANETEAMGEEPR